MILLLQGFSDFSDLEEELETTKGRTNLREKFKQLQEILLIVQKVLGYIGDMEERVRKYVVSFSLVFRNVQ